MYSGTLLDSATDGGGDVAHGRSEIGAPTRIQSAEVVALLELPRPTGFVPCQENDAELWFAEQAVDVERAKALCGQCPLTAQCLAGALARREPWGVWGGQVFVDGVVVATKRGRGRPRKSPALTAA